jgi:hypothetical protein
MITVNLKPELPYADVHGMVERELQEHREIFEATAAMVNRPFANSLRLLEEGVRAGGGQMAALCDALIVVPSAVTARIQEMHITIGHMLCKALEQRLGLV